MTKSLSLVMLILGLTVGMSAQTLKETIEDREKQVYAAIKKHDSKTFESLLTKDSVVVYGMQVSPATDMSKIIGDAKNGDLDVTIDNYQIFQPNSDTVVSTFTAKKDSTDSAGKHDLIETRESTVWVKKNGKWLAAYHDMGELPATK